MTPEHYAPQSVYLACCRGLKRVDRYRRHTTDHGGTQASIEFATAVFNQEPVDIGSLADLIEAHRLLDTAPRRPDGETVAQVTARLLWGGDEAVDWAQQIIGQTRTPNPTPNRPEPVVVTASVSTDQKALAGLAADLAVVDTQTITQLETAWWFAYRTALRAATGAARTRTRRVPVAVQASANLEGDDLNQIRTQISSDPVNGIRHLPEPLAAAISFDLDQALQGTLTDFETVAQQIMTQATAESIRRVADRFGLTVDEVNQLAPSDTGPPTAAIGLRVGLLDWIRARLDTRPDGTETEAETLFNAPRQLFNQAIKIAGGAAAVDQVASIGTGIVDRVVQAVTRQQLTPTRVTLRAVTRVEPEWEWVYGTPATRFAPHPEHVPLGGIKWRSETERTEKVGTNSPGDHIGCQCRIAQRWILS